MAKNDTFVGKEISHLMKSGPSKGPQKGKPMKQKQAIAVALDVARRKGIDVPKKDESLARTPLQTLDEVSPPGWHGTVRAMKTHGHTGKGKDKIDNPYALAWSMKNKGDEPHYKDLETSKRGKPEKKAKFKDEDNKEEAVSIFDALVERELPEAFKKNMGKWKIKGGENPDAKKKGADYEGPEDADVPEQAEESRSIFDALVQESGPPKSVFDDIVESSDGKSLFDDLVEGTAAANWEDRVARTLTLAEDLVGIRNSVRTK